MPEAPTDLAAADQPGLPLLTALRLVRSGIGFRIVRSGITVSIQALAVAFLVFTLALGLLESRVAAIAAERLAPTTADRVAVTRLSRPDPPAEVAAAMADGAAPDAYRRWSGLPAEQWAAAVSLAGRLAASERWAEALPPAARAAALGGRSPAEAAARLGDAAAAASFAEAVDALRPADRTGLPVAGGAELAELWTRGRSRVAEAVGATAAGHARAVAALARRYGGRDPAAVVAEDPEGLGIELERAGFDAGRVRAAAAEARRLADAALLAEALQQPELRRSLARPLGVTAAEVTPAAALRLARDAEGADRLAAELAAVGVADPPPPQRLAALARARAEADALAAVSARGGASRGRTALLLGLSALVCVVGIGNAMLMSVTERFGEIATMKCLGARSGSILRMYLLEALLLGVVGAAAGAALGLLLALLAALLSTGRLLALALPAAGEVALAVLLAALAGVALSAVAAVLPSLLAARLSPMEALRVE